jgi:hypothetical protein
MIRIFAVTLGFLYLSVIEIFKALHNIAAFKSNTQLHIVAIFIDLHIWWLRIAGIPITLFPFIYFVIRGKRLQKFTMWFVLLGYTLIVYACNFIY